MKPGKKNIKLNILITGRELEELQRYTGDMAESFGLDSRIDQYKGKRPIGLYCWDFECLLCAIEGALKDQQNYPDKDDPGYLALKQLYDRLKHDFNITY
ncbi:MAG: hypothetical protein ABR542_09955 [Desulfonatronovibrio sp.]|nr:hypothetical protein [Desulfovibrionales bacterium]